MNEPGDFASCIADDTTRSPRYTSYPPSTELGKIAVDWIRRELATLGRDGTTVSLYAHVPCCPDPSAGRGCDASPASDPERGVAYVDQLATELALLAGPLRGARVTELALGGAAPSFLAPRTLRTLVGAIDRSFTVAPGARRSVELDPAATPAAQLDALAGMGFRSLSLGVQDFAEEVQDAIGRHQSIAQTRWLVEQARAHGFDDVNVELAYGLPRQTEASFAATLDAVIDLAPDRVAVFGYAHRPAKLPHPRPAAPADRVLDAFERAALMLLALERLSDAGYLHLGLDHFARSGSRLARAAAERRMVRTFQGYVERYAEATVGAGVSAISSTPRMQWENHADLPAWEAALAGRWIPACRGVVLDRDDRARAALIERLMCDGEVDLVWLGREHAIDPEAYFAAELAALDQLPNLARYDPNRRAIATTPIGRMLVRNVCMVFDRYDRGAEAEPRLSQTL